MTLYRRGDGSRQRSTRGRRMSPPQWLYGDPITAADRKAVEELAALGFRKVEIGRKTGLTLRLVRAIIDGPEAVKYESIAKRREVIKELVALGYKLDGIVNRLRLPEDIVRADLKRLGVGFSEVPEMLEPVESAPMLQEQSASTD